MNIHDKAHELARDLQQSTEYRDFLAAKKGISGDADTQKMIKEFFAKQVEIEYEALAGKPQDKNKAEQLQKMYDLLICNAKSRDFIQTHMRFQRVMADVYKIIGEAVAEGMDFFAKK